MGRTLVYPKRSQNTVNRYSSRATYDLLPIHEIINSANVLHVSFSPSPSDPFPAILPMIGQMGSFEHPSAGLDEPLQCYLHGYVSSRIMRLAKAAIDGSESTEEGEGMVKGKGLPVCIAASHVDGLILALTPNNHSYNYRSAILQGYATLVTDVAEKMYAMELVTNSVVADRWDHTRVPPDAAEMSSTTILKVEIVSGSGKVRNGTPHDEKKDIGREEIINSVWTGVVPVYEVLGAPERAGDSKVEEVPEHVLKYIAERNEKSKRLAYEAAEMEVPSS